MNLSSILTVADKPKHKQVALAGAAQLQRALGAQIDATAFCWQAFPDEVFGAAQRKAMKREIMDDRKAWLAETVKDVGLDADLTKQTTVWTHDMAEWICNAAEKHGNDLVLKSVHPSKTMVHTPLDWELLERCPVPVMLRSTRVRRKKSNIVLAAVDLGTRNAAHKKLNRKVLDAATYYASRVGAKVHCVHVIEMSKVLRDLDLVDERTVRRKAIAKSESNVAELISRYPLVKSRIHFPVGKVGQQVQQLGFKLKADLLVMGTHTRRLRNAVGIGSSAQKVLSRLPCDVLAVHP